MDRVQVQTSPRGAMILSLIVHTHTRTHTQATLTCPPRLLPFKLTHTPLLSTRITGRINLCLTPQGKKRVEEEKEGEGE